MDNIEDDDVITQSVTLIFDVKSVCCILFTQNSASVNDVSLTNDVTSNQNVTSGMRHGCR